MEELRKIVDCYNKTAENSPVNFIDELDHKHLDRILLNAFAGENPKDGKFADLGCGPGQITNFLYNCGLKNITGIDLSPKMISVARKFNPHLNFETGDILDLKYPDRSFTSAVAFYSIVHFTYDQVKISFEEVKRVLGNNGQFLFTFHTGDNKIHLDTFLDKQVDIDFHFFDCDKIAGLLDQAGFQIVDIIERQAYKDFEYPSKRAYIWVKCK